MESVAELQNNKKKIEEEMNKVNEELRKIKNKLGDLLEEKERLDVTNVEISKEIEALTLILDEDEDDSVALHSDQDIKDVTDELDMLIRKKKDIQDKNEALEQKCKIMEEKFSELFQGTDQEDTSELFYRQLEVIRREKEQIIAEDEIIENETKALWKEAEDIKSEMDLLTRINARLNEDTKEIQEILEKIDTERGKLIAEDKLLDERYPPILESLKSVCEERKELLKKIDSTDEGTEERDQLSKSDLEAALKQKRLEDLFNGWKEEKERILGDNKELDLLMGSLRGKCEIVNQKKREVAEKNQQLERDSEKLKEKFSINQFKKERIISDFRKNEETLNDTTNRVEKFYDDEEIAKKKALEELVKDFGQIKDDKIVIMNEDTEISEKIDLMNSKCEEIRNKKIEDKRIINSSKKLDAEDRIQVLIELRAANLEQDQTIADEFEKYEKMIDQLQQNKSNLTQQIEDLDWQLCLDGNSI